MQLGTGSQRPNPKGGVNGDSQQHASAATPAPVLSQQQTAAAKQQSHGCPGTHQSELDCNAITAVATVRQADAAETFNNLAYLEIGVGLVTALVAFLAAKFAKDAVAAARDNLTHDKVQAKASLRPWLCWAGFEPAFYTEGGNINGQHVPRLLAASISMINTGQTPALNVRPIIRHQITDANVQQAPDFPPRAEEFVDAGAAGPGRPISTSARTVGPPECDAIMEGRSCLWLYARAEYEGPNHEGDAYVTEVTLRIMREARGVGPHGEAIGHFGARVAGPRNGMT